MTHTATQRVFQILTADPDLHLMEVVHGEGGEVRLAVFELAGDFVLVAAHKVPGPFTDGGADGPGDGEEEWAEYDPDADSPGE